MARTILLADDSMTIQKVVELTFMDEDYQVVAVSDGSSAIQKLSEMRPDLLIADVHMPGAGGYDVCRHAKANLSGLPVLLLVGTFEQFDEAEAKACGSDGYLKKPFDSQELLNRVDALVSAAAPAAAAPMVSPASEPMVLPSAMPQETRVPEMPTAPAPPPIAPSQVAPPQVAPQPPSAPQPSAPQPATPQPATPEPAAPQPAAPQPPPVVEMPQSLMTPPTGSDTPADTVDTRPMGRKSARVEPPAAQEAHATETPAVEAASAPTGNGLSDGDVDRIARRVAELLSDKILKEVAWEVLPDLAEVVVRERIHELERQVESA